MNSKAVLVRTIEQKDNHIFTIEWSDGATGTYRLSDLQRQCPCAKCVDEWTGKPLLDKNTVKNDVKARRIVSLGRYALRIEFTSGCSTGIYGFDLLRTLAENNK